MSYVCSVLIGYTHGHVTKGTVAAGTLIVDIVTLYNTVRIGWLYPVYT